MKHLQKRLNLLKAAWAVKAQHWPVCISSALLMCAGGAALYTSPASAEGWASGRQTMVYEVYAGGIHALQAQLSMDLKSNRRYDIVLSAKTFGLLGKLAPWHGTFESSGVYSNEAGFRPYLHRSTTVWKDEEQVKSYEYNKDGSFKSLTIKEFDKPAQTKSPDAALTDQTTDALSATLSALMNVSAGQGCAYSADVFDGKRRFTQMFQPQEQELLQQSRYNIFEGLSEVCAVEIKPVAGAWHNKPRGWMSIQEQGRQKGTMPSVWMAQIDPHLPAIPIKILVKTNYGALYMHLAEYHSGSDIRVAEKRVTNPENQ